MIIEIEYKKDFLFNEKLIDQNKCFVYFHTGENCDYLTSYFYIKELEKKFDININFFDISYFLNGFKEKTKNSKIKFSKEDIKKIINEIKNMYKNSIKLFLMKGENEKER